MRRPHRRAHRLAWAILVVALPAIIVAAFLLRGDASELPAPQRLDAAEGERP